MRSARYWNRFLVVGDACMFGSSASPMFLGTDEVGAIVFQSSEVIWMTSLPIWTLSVFGPVKLIPGASMSTGSVWPGRRPELLCLRAPRLWSWPRGRV